MDFDRSTSLTFLAQAGSAVTIFLGFILFTRILGPDRFGLFILFLGAVNLLTLFTDLGINGALQKRISEGEEQSDILASATVLKLGLLGLLIVGIVVGRDYLNEYFGEQIAIWLIGGVLVQQFGTLFTDCLKGELKVAEAEGVLFARRILFVLTGLGMGLLNESVVAVLVGYQFSWIVVGLWAFYRVETSFGAFRLHSVWSIYDFAKYNVISSMVSERIYSWADVIIVGLLLSNTHVTAYEMAWRLAGMAMLLSRSIGLAAFPRISSLHSKEDTNAIDELVPLMTFGALVTVFPAIGGVYVLSEELLSILFSPELVIAAPALLVLTFGKIPESLTMIYGQILLGINKPNLAVFPTVAATILNIVLNLILVTEFGLVGAAFATTLSMCLSLSLVAHNLSDEVSIQIPLKELKHLVLPSIIMTVVIYSIERTLVIDTIYQLLLTVLLGFAIYILILIISVNNTSLDETFGL